MNGKSEAWGWQAYWPAISWSGIFAGWLFAWAFAMLLYLFGAAAGITTMAAMNDFSKGVAIGTGVWVVLSWIIATFAGGWLAARLAGRPNQGVGAMHGLVVWALCGVMTVMIGSAQAAGVVSAGGKTVQQIARPTEVVVAAADPSSASLSGPASLSVPESVVGQEGGTLEAPAEELEPAGESGDQRAIREALIRFDQGDLDLMRTQIATGRVEETRTLLSENTEMSREQIDLVIANLSGTGDQPTSETTPAPPVENPADWAGGALWVLFLASIFGLAAGVAGGMLGARRSEEFYASLAASAPPPPPQEYVSPRHEREEEAAERW